MNLGKHMAGKIRDEFIEEIAFELNFKERKRLRHTGMEKWGRMLQNRKQQD